MNRYLCKNRVYIFGCFITFQGGSRKCDIIADRPELVPVAISEDNIPEHKKMANWVLDVDGSGDMYWSVDSKGQICQFKNGASRSMKVGMIHGC